MGEERRITVPEEARLQTLREGEDDAVAVQGVFCVYASPSVDMGFVEVIERGALTRAIERSDIRALYNHDANYVLGRTPQTLRVWEADDGGHFRVPSMPRSRADVAEAIDRGDVTGCSFAFRVLQDDWAQGADGLAIRRILEIQEVYDVGPVVYPAYPDTTVALRSLDAWRQEGHHRSQREQRLRVARWRLAHAELDRLLHQLGL